MSAEVLTLDDTRRRVAVESLSALIRCVESGEVCGLAAIAIHSDGGFFEPVCFASHALGRHAGSILRGAVCWLGAEMDQKGRRE